LTAADGSAISSDGVATEEWYRLRLQAETEGYEVTVENLAADGDGAPIRFAIGSVPVSQICLAIDGPPGAAAHFDNLALHSQSALEG
jgi:hypothetical protein